MNRRATFRTAITSYGRKQTKPMFGFAKKYTEQTAIEDCLKGKQAAQEWLYKRFSSRMLGVSMRYLPDRAEAEDAMIAGLVKVFQHLHTFKQQGSFEGWVRRIVVNEALALLRKKAGRHQTNIEQAEGYCESDGYADAAVHTEELLALVQQLPTGYRTVFNLYAIEGYSHQEIADMLGISESTSKSQLNRARNMLKSWIAALEQPITLSSPKEL
ncbi:RNA polymerase sigma factor [Rhodoflexus sp.]